MDLVPNHTSSQHAWFRAAVAAGRGASRERYIFRDGRGVDGALPPNNWVSVFGGPAWTRVTEPDGHLGQWYLHLFDAEQPDLNWDNPEVFDDFEKTLRFWMDRGVDGFRIDVAHGMAKPSDLPDMKNPNIGMLKLDDNDPRFNHDGVHDIHRAIRRVFNDYPDAVAIGEVWVFDNEQVRQVPAPRRAASGFQLPAAARRVRRRRHPRCDHQLAGGGRDRGRDAHLDAGQPRRRARGHPLRQWRGRAGAGAGDGAGDAGVTGCGVRVQRPGARAAERRAARRGAAGSGVVSFRRPRARP